MRGRGLMSRCRIAGLVLAGLSACGEPAREEASGAPGQVPAASPADSGETGNTEEGLIDGRDAGTKAAAAVDPIAALPPTELPLTLLATMRAPDPADAGATIRNDDTGVIRQYRVITCLKWVICWLPHQPFGMGLPQSMPIPLWTGTNLMDVIPSSPSSYAQTITPTPA